VFSLIIERLSIIWRFQAVFWNQWWPT